MVGGAGIASVDGPSCKGLLEELRFGDVELDRCASCRGIWFDVGELESYRAARAKGSGPAPTPGFEANHEAPPLRCPGCKSATLESGRTKGDHDLRQCSVCGGIFVPRKTLSKLEAAATSPSLGSQVLAGLDVGISLQLAKLLERLVDGLFDGS